MLKIEKQPNLERQEQVHKIDDLLAANAQRINAEFQEQGGEPPVLADGRVNMAMWPDYDPEDVRDIEIKNSGIDDSDIRNFRLGKMKERGINVDNATDDDIIKFWKAENEKLISTRW